MRHISVQRYYSILVLIGLGLGPGYGYAQNTSPPDPDLGRNIYLEQCELCHLDSELKAPSVDSMKLLSFERILFSLTDGVMMEEGALLSVEERNAVVGYLAQDRPAGTRTRNANRCAGLLSDLSPIRWTGWANDVTNSRFQSGVESGLTHSNVDKLALKWAYAFPDTIRMRAQPAITQETVYLGGQTGEVTALSAETGCIWWTFEADAEVRGALSLVDAENGNTRALVLSDFEANVYRLNASTGNVEWKVNVAEHANGTITGALTVFEDLVIIPLSSTEILNAANPNYACCTFRGGLMALNLNTGKEMWRAYAVAEPSRQKPNSVGTPQWGPSGAPAWGSPTIDARRRQVYFGTGQNYSSPASQTSDAVIAVDVDTGRRVWTFQTLAGDAWNAACVNDGPNCPVENGPDFDVGAAPVLITLDNGTDAVIAGNKGGIVFALNPENGQMMWQKRVGRGGRKGGVHWGLASDGDKVYVGVGDLPDEFDSPHDAQPGLHALDASTGATVWTVSAEPTCAANSFRCYPSFSGALTVTSDVVFAGGMDGRLHAFATRDGAKVWGFDTDRTFETVNGIPGQGGSIDSDGAVIADGRLLINSGYDLYGQLAGNVLLMFAIEEE